MSFFTFFCALLIFLSSASSLKSVTDLGQCAHSLCKAHRTRHKYSVPWKYHQPLGASCSPRWGHRIQSRRRILRRLASLAIEPGSTVRNAKKKTRAPAAAPGLLEDTGEAHDTYTSEYQHHMHSSRTSLTASLRCHESRRECLLRTLPNHHPRSHRVQLQRLRSLII